jgi:hypothetical protein
MTNTHGNQLAKSYSGKYHPDLVLAFQILILFFAGMSAVVLHARFRSPIGLPGHHGLEFMALTALFALRFKFKLRGIFFALGAGSALFIPFVGFTDPFAEIMFMLPSLVLCLLMDAFRYAERFKSVALIAFGGFAYMCIPLIRLLIHAGTGFPYKSLLINPFYTTAMHFVFGAIGTVAGYYIYRGLKSL